MNYTEKEFEILKQYENYFKTAVYSDYSRNVMQKDLEIMQSIYERAIGMRYPVNFSCGGCQLAFLKKVGKRYFEDKEAYERTEPDLIINELQEGATDKDKKNNKEEKPKKKNGKDNTKKGSKK